MNAVLRLTLTYFCIVPLQKWLSMTGVLLIAAAPLIHSPVYALFTFLGGAFIAFVPSLMGGTSMRFGSSRGTLQLRPGARWKMLAAALLTVCVMTAICVFSMWVATRTGMRPRLSTSAGPPLPLGEFALVMAGGLALLWIVSFVASASRLWTMLVPIGIIALTSQRWSPLSAIGPLPVVLAIGAIVAWLIFAYWYLNTRQVSRPAWVSSAAPLGMGENNTGGWYSELTESRADSRAVAIKAYLLGTTSKIGFLLPGVISALIVLPVYYLQHNARNGVVMLPVTFLAIFSGVAGGMSYMVARRARMLWLRAGLDRAGLFALGERTALQAFSQMVFSAAVVLGLFSIIVKPDMTPKILLFVIAQLAYATVLFYFGLSQTRAWTAAGMAICVVLGLGLIAQMIVVMPQAVGIPAIVTPVMVGVSVLISLLLRQLARKRWLTLDWHLTRPPVVQRQTR